MTNIGIRPLQLCYLRYCYILAVQGSEGTAKIGVTSVTSQLLHHSPTLLTRSFNAKE